MRNGHHPSPAVTLSAALDQMEREAKWRKVRTPRYRSRTVEWGEGPALVFINGLGDDPKSFALPMRLLSQHFRCIGYTLPMGHHDKARLGSYQHDHLLEDLNLILDELKVDQATLLGHSFGSTITLRALNQSPDRFPRGISVCGFARRPLSNWHWWLAAVGKFLTHHSKLCHLRGRVVAMRKAHYTGFDRAEPERWEQFLAITGASPMKSLGHFGHVLHKLDLRPQLPQIKQPVLVLTGDSDPLVPRGHAEMLFQGLPNSVMFELQRCGHLPMYTHPDAMATAVLTFLGYLPPPGSPHHDCGTGPNATGHCPTTGEFCAGKEVVAASQPVAAACPPVVTA